VTENILFCFSDRHLSYILQTDPACGVSTSVRQTMQILTYVLFIVCLFAVISFCIMPFHNMFHGTSVIPQLHVSLVAKPPSYIFI